VFLILSLHFLPQVSLAEFPLITWFEKDRIPFSADSGFASPVCADIDMDGDFDCKFFFFFFAIEDNTIP
jgi:hypothetical protein